MANRPDDKTTEQLMLARRYIQRRDYANARYILLQVEHPIADRWIRKINQMDGSYSEKTDYRFYLIGFLVVGLTLLALYIMTGRLLLSFPVIIISLLILSLISRIARRPDIE